MAIAPPTRQPPEFTVRLIAPRVPSTNPSITGATHMGEVLRETEAAGTMRRRSSAARGRRRGGGRSCAERRERQGGGERLDGGESSPLGFGGGRRP